jgi:hypothetical protein
VVGVELAAELVDLRIDLNGVDVASTVLERQRDVGPIAGPHFQDVGRRGRSPLVRLRRGVVGLDPDGDGTMSW